MLQNIGVLLVFEIIRHILEYTSNYLEMPIS